MDWKSGNNTQQSLPEGYTFLYDALSRLTAADYHLNDTRSNNYDTRYTYDSMGNILTLKRRGLKQMGSQASSSPSGQGTQTNSPPITGEGQGWGDIYALIDDITFDYYGNQITKATDAVSDGPYYQGAWHYRDRTDADEERAYDANGNLTSDSDANISSIQYNSLNLPTVIAFTDGSTTSYQYDALGRKLRVEHKTMTTGTFHPDTGTEDPGDVGSAPDPEVGEEAGEEGGEWQWPVEGEVWPALAGLEEMEGEEGEPAEGEEPTLPPTEPLLPPLPPTCLPYEITVTDYVGSYIYENSKLSRLMFDGGFYTFDSDSLNLECHYYFTDHLGSVRVVTDANGNVEQTNNYYPYGGLMASSSCITNPSSSTAANQPNRYNGKELDRRNALDWHDYGARHFDGIVWRNVDKLAEKYFEISPYVYCIGNPIRYVDPDGNEAFIKGECSKEYIDLLQLFVGEELNLFLDDNNLLSYREQTENGKLSNNAKLIKKIIDSKDITLHITTTGDYHTTQGDLLVGGAFMGVIFSDNHVNAYQEVNPFVLKEMDYFIEKKGTSAAHEFTESYYAAKSALALNESDTKYGEKNRYYEDAHQRAIEQPLVEPIYYTMLGKSTKHFTQGVKYMKAEWFVSSKRNKHLIMTY